MANRLSKIVTRSGDAGKAGLSDGSRVDKDAPRMEAIGTVDELPPLKELILPSGSTAFGAFHIARTVARRAERRLLSALEIDPQPGRFGLAYLNRLSDVLFVAARHVGRLEGTKEVIWEAKKSVSS